MAYSFQQQSDIPPPVQYNQPKMQMVESDLVFANEWANGLCDCCSDCGACCYALFCMPCFACKFDEASKECACTTICCGSNGLMMNRAKLRGAYKIRGSLFEDCCLAHCCPFCVMLQQWNEMKYRGDILD